MEKEARRDRQGRRRKLALTLILSPVLVAGLGTVAVWGWGWDALPLSLLPFASAEPSADGDFLVKPYLQWGPGASLETVEIHWQGYDRDERWTLEARPSATDSSSASTPASGSGWQTAGTIVPKRLEVELVAPRRQYRGVVPASALSAGTFEYRVAREGKPVFSARAHIPPRGPAPQAHRFVLFGDGGADTWAQRKIAFQAFEARPDFVFIAGDLVYYKGSFSDYLRKFFPVYNSDRAAASAGAPLLRSTLVLAAAGNHDLIERDLDRCPDGLAYFLLWSLPLNGPLTHPGAAGSPVLLGSNARQRAFLARAKDTYPQMANYSVEIGGVHWTVLDTNPYTDWTDPALRDWLERDLSSDTARKAAWRFVAFHHPPFHSSRAHADEQRSRVLVDLFEKHGVDLVFSGHIHNYERTYPMRFAAARRPGANSQAAQRPRPRRLDD